ncbi:MAG: hypothetical protein LBS42_00985 [Tannerella sp.]|nr:hypothetical protein [Tannerella sp.]
MSGVTVEPVQAAAAFAERNKLAEKDFQRTGYFVFRHRMTEKRIGNNSETYGRFLFAGREQGARQQQGK